jgi:hypothetical protein
MLTGEGSPQSFIGIQKRRFGRVHEQTANPLTNASALVTKENKNVALRNRGGIFVCVASLTHHPRKPPPFK